MVAIVVALALMALAIVLAVMLAARQGSPPSTAPAAETSPGPATSLPTPSPSSSLPPTETETPEAGLTPVQPPVTVPPVPEPAQPERTALPPTDQFPPSLRGQDLTVIPGAGRLVALTFDAGANSAGLPKILSALSAKGVAGTFFTDLLIAQQILAAEQVIEMAGADPRPFFRFPYGERNARTIAAVNDLGYVAVRWTVDTLGWKGTSGGINKQTVTERVLASLQPGGIVLMHIGSNPEDGSTLDADALPEMIDRIRAAGYGFTTLDAVLGG